MPRRLVVPKRKRPGTPRDPMARSHILAHQPVHLRVPIPIPAPPPTTAPPRLPIIILIIIIIVLTRKRVRIILIIRIVVVIRPVPTPVSRAPPGSTAPVSSRHAHFRETEVDGAAEEEVVVPCFDEHSDPADAGRGGGHVALRSACYLLPCCDDVLTHRTTPTSVRNSIQAV